MTLSRGLLLIGILGLSCLAVTIYKEQQTAVAQQYIQTIKYRNLVIDLPSLTVDRKLCLVVELKDDTKDNSYKEVGLATYSNTESLVWTHASIFETLWIKSELYKINSIHKE
jgi:hypothetical protein